MPIHQELIDADAQKVIRRLVRAKHQAYFVGGCVRDLLLERTPKDFDIATSATPPQIKDLFRNCRIIGRRFRLAHIFFGQKIIETATFRANPREVDSDGGEGDDALPTSEDLLIRRDNVFGNAEEDARRRDFTINGLFYDLDADQVIDYVGGLTDLASRTVRTIGDPDIRFREDPVRILRAVKFAARLDFQVEPAAWQAIMVHKVEIPKCPAPRVLEEVYRLLRGGAGRRSMELLRETGILELLMPELAALVAAEGGDSPSARWWWQTLDRIDVRMRRRDFMPSNAVLLCALLGPFVGMEVLEEAEGPGQGQGRIRDIGQVIEDRIRPLLERMRVSRRDSERVRQILLSQRRIAPSKRRRGKPLTLVRRDYFQEALDVYELLAPARPGTAQEGDAASWRKMAQDASQGGLLSAQDGDESGDTDEAAVSPGEEPRKRRRRRRGGRNRPRPDGTAGATPAAALAAKPDEVG
ncbi:MAG: polynucleotide adenylyltransferase PcnB [Myxococcales bacterium]|nr:polynucleotide adenylyltransferase PcnB [Myxococcales bacterium]